MFQKWIEGVSRQKISAMVLFGAIIIVFVFFGYQRMDNTKVSGWAASVNDRIISTAQVAQQEQNLKSFYARLFGGQFDGEGPQMAWIRSAALEQLIGQEVMVQASAQAGIRVTDDEVADAVRSNQAFQKDGKFQRDIYEGLLAQNGFTPAQYEEQIRGPLQIQRLERIFHAAALPSQREVEREVQARETKLNVEFVQFGNDELKGSQISASEKEQFASNAENAKRISDYYQVNKDKYSIPAQVHARHILIKTIPGKRSEDEALNAAKELSKRVQSEDFAKVAKEVSEDEGSQKQGGDLGFFPKGRMVPEFDEVAFQLKVGDVSEPVKTMFGYHLIKLEERKEPEEKKLEDVRSQIAEELLREKKTEEFKSQLAKALEGQSKDQVEGLLKTAGLKWQESGLFALTEERNPKLGSSEVVTIEATKLSKVGQYSSRVLADGPRNYILKLKEIKKPGALTDETLRLVRDQLVLESARDLQTRWVEVMKSHATIRRNGEVAQVEKN